MNEKYNEIMGKIEVTEPMRQRILQNIRKAELSGKPETIRFPRWKPLVSIAACFAILLAGVRIAPALYQQQHALSGQDEPHFSQEETPSGQDRSDLGTGSIEDCASADDLAQAVGFAVSEPSYLPFDVVKTAYTSYWAELAELSYYGANGENAVCRKSEGTDDNSGQYTEYAETQKMTVDDRSVTLKGADGIYELAWWTDGEYAYSVWLSDGVSQAEWEDLISGWR